MLVLISDGAMHGDAAYAIAESSGCAIDLEKCTLNSETLKFMRPQVTRERFIVCTTVVLNSDRFQRLRTLELIHTQAKAYWHERCLALYRNHC